MIIAFSEHHVENIINLVEQYIPKLSGFLSKSLAQQKKKLYEPASDLPAEPNILQKGWEVFIFLMIGYFVMSFINSLV